MTIGRTANNEFLEIIKFKIIKEVSSFEFAKENNTIPSELFVKYLLVFQNIQNKRIESLFFDLFNQKSSRINLNAIKYCWVISESNGVITLKFNRILADFNMEEIGPHFELQIAKEFYCGNDIYEKAVETKKIKKQKNVEKNEFKDTVGRVYVDKQDLNNIMLKKSRGHKSN